MIGLIKQNDQPARSQRKFIAKSLQSLPHHSMLAFSSKGNIRPAKRLLNAKHPIELNTRMLRRYDDQIVRDYMSVVARAKLWHGTGRLQHFNESVVDVLDSIIRSGSIRPAYDAYAVLAGGQEMVSLSMTPHRMVARSYADVHGKGAAEQHRYGDSLHWAAYFYSTYYAELFLRSSVKVVHNWSAWRKSAADTSGAIKWGQKVNRRACYVWDVFDLGSDIPGNYPIVFGIADFGKTIEVPPCFRHIEVRSTEPVTLDAISHIEVPERFVHEVRRLLLQYDYKTPVFAIELGEYTFSQRKFSDLVGR